MTPAELRRAAREAEALGDFKTAHQLRERDTEPAPPLPYVALDLASMDDTSLEVLAECIAGEMIRRGRESAGEETR